MINYEIIEALTQIARERGLEKEFLIDALKEALLTGARKKFGKAENIEVDVNEDSGEIKVLQEKTVVQEVDDPAEQIALEEAKETDPDAEMGDTVKVELPFGEFGRNAVLVAKQMMYQKVREAEREHIYSDLSEKIGDIITGSVQQVDRRGVTVNLGRAEGIIPPKEQIPTEHYRQGNNVRAYVVDVRLSPRGPSVLLSRTHPSLLKKLLTFEVPEIYEAIVEIRAVAREPGDRSKVAVYSHDGKIDPVGACVGVKGSRVQTVVRELNNEKIDIIQWSQDPLLFVNRALSPAKVTKSFIDEDNDKVTAVIPDDQLSLAIGKGGQNARLAVKLTGWKIDIISDTEYRSRLEKAEKSKILIEDLPTLTKRVKDRLIETGYRTAWDVSQADQKELRQIPGVGEKTAAKIVRAVSEACAK